MAILRANAFVPFNGGNPSNLTQHDPLPRVALKSLPIFTGEDHVTPIEHISDVTSLFVVHHITQGNIALKLLAASLKGKALQWFRGLLINLVNDWDDLDDKLTKQFADKSDHLSLVEQMTTIKRAPQE